ncbi:hypothetical protein FY134_02975 [Agrobacterium fabrum]|uniref:hypothetical protein n=1 Tax=Agrobacterium fabrum TaxID=1176649 RepID=UPI0021D0DCC5|nr:hypothetical protein [Agrobacterium fabrum]UXT56661.1 hypothetical protein FY134_02975 [Agrobacterium fabrum]
MNKQETCTRLLTTARVSLMFDAPFFGNLAMRMTLNPDDKCSDMRGRFFDLSYNPAFVLSLTPLTARNRMKLEILYLIEERMIGDTLRSRVRRDLDTKTQAADRKVLAAILSAAMAVNCAGIPEWILICINERATAIEENDQWCF